MLNSTLSVEAVEVEQLMLVVDKYHQVSSQSSARVSFACDVPASMTVVEFFSCFECRGTRSLPTVSSSGQTVPCVSLLQSLPEMKRKKLGLCLFVFSVSEYFWLQPISAYIIVIILIILKWFSLKI